MPTLLIRQAGVRSADWPISAPGRAPLRNNRMGLVRSATRRVRRSNASSSASVGCGAKAARKSPTGGCCCGSTASDSSRSIDARHSTTGRSRGAVESGRFHLRPDAVAVPRIPAGRRRAPRAEELPPSFVPHQSFFLMTALSTDAWKPGSSI